MKSISKVVRLLILSSSVAFAVLVTGCSWNNKVSKFMTVTTNPATSPPPGKSLVCIHRPKAVGGRSLYYFGIWDGEKFIADVGNGNSVAYVCEPGTHYFLSLFPSVASCIEAHLLPGKTYDLLARRGWTGRLQPLPQDDKTRRKVEKWSRNDRWIEPAATAALYEQEKRVVVRQYLEDFISGKRHNKLQQLAAEAHR